MWSQRTLSLVTLMIGVFLFALPVHSDAACSREDVGYYLEKGFSQEQITAICTAEKTDTEKKIQSSVKEKPTPAVQEKTPSVNTPLGQKLESQPQQIQVLPDSQQNKTDLAIAIQGYDVKVDSQALGYTVDSCIEYGEKDLFGFKDEACPEIRYTINLKGMEIISSSKKMLFFGKGEVRVRGIINREVLSGLEKLKADEKKKFMDHLEDGNETVIPIREGIPLDRVKASLRKLAR